MVSNPLQEQMENQIVKALEEALKKEGEKIKNELVKEFDRELNGKIAGLVLHMMKMVEMQTMNDRLIITIKNETN